MRSFIIFNIVAILLFVTGAAAFRHIPGMSLIFIVAAVVFIAEGTRMILELLKLDKEIKALKQENKDLREYDSMC